MPQTPSIFHSVYHFHSKNSKQIKWANENNHTNDANNNALLEKIQQNPRGIFKFRLFSNKYLKKLSFKREKFSRFQEILIFKKTFSILYFQSKIKPFRSLPHRCMKGICNFCMIFLLYFLYFSFITFPQQKTKHVSVVSLH